MRTLTKNFTKKLTQKLTKEKLQTLRLVSVVAFLTAILGLAGCSTLDKISENDAYQKTKEVVSSWVNYVGTKTSEFIESNETAQKVVKEAEKYWQEVLSGVKAEADNLIKEGEEMVREEVNKMKENVKKEIKNKVNKEIDESFDSV